MKLGGHPAAVDTDSINNGNTYRVEQQKVDKPAFAGQHEHEPNPE